MFLVILGYYEVLNTITENKIRLLRNVFILMLCFIMSQTASVGMHQYNW